MDELTLVKVYYNDKKYSVIIYICPSLTTYSEFWPSYRVCHANSKTKLVKDYTQWRLNLNETNKKDKPIWYISYKASQLYNLSDKCEFNSNNYKELLKWKKCWLRMRILFALFF